jgi:hypothetical protein
VNGLRQRILTEGSDGMSDVDILSIVMDSPSLAYRVKQRVFRG